MYINNQKSSIYLLGHGISPQLFISNNDPVQLWPPYCGGIQALDLTLEPLPQVTLHGDQLPQADKTPSTFNNKNEINLSIYLSTKYIGTHNPCNYLKSTQLENKLTSSYSQNRLETLDFFELFWTTDNSKLVYPGLYI